MKYIIFFFLILFLSCKKDNSIPNSKLSYSDAINKSLGLTFEEYYAYNSPASSSSMSQGVLMFGKDTSVTEVFYNSSTPKHPYDTMFYKLIYNPIDSDQVEFSLKIDDFYQTAIIDSLLYSPNGAYSVGLLARDFGIFSIMIHNKNGGSLLYSEHNYTNDIRFHGAISYPIDILK
jgi:hypothetical protein